MDEALTPSQLIACQSTALPEAQETRRLILEHFIDSPFKNTELIDPEPKEWVIETIAEAYFGLCRYDEAEIFIEKHRELHRDPWKLKTFVEQLFSLVRLQLTRQQYLEKAGINEVPGVQQYEGKIDKEGIKKCLDILDIKGTLEGTTERDGKKGIAFSGGGFRAAFFHIGVLAGLAERDELRDIEVISCVSGGSIIGAYYYLKLKLLLLEKDDDVTREDYINMVKSIEAEFMTGVSKNLRMHIFSNLAANIRMLRKDYSRSNRLGELYEEYLYVPMLREHFKAKRDGATQQGRERLEKFKKTLVDNKWCIYMSDLFIRPTEDFEPERDNWKRKNKIPQLILNATSVNTGHNFQFTASWMGEPATGIISDIDVKPRLRRIYYNQAPGTYKQFRLGRAVGASSCVPVMFEPLPMHDLYPSYELQLIDGGLHDNQGIAAIIEEECKNVIISDASGQLPTNKKSVVSALPVFLRADNILQERLRELQFLDMRQRDYSLLLNKLTCLHLKNGINGKPVNWKDCTDPPRTVSYINPDLTEKDLLPYDVLRSTQQLISEIRTDLDAFHEIEAFALMYNGYVQIRSELDNQTSAPVNVIRETDWHFLDIKENMRLPDKADEIKNLLAISSRVPFKVLFLLPKSLKIMLIVGLFAGVGLLLYNFRYNLHNGINLSGWNVLTTAAIITVGIFNKPLGILLDPTGYFRKKLIALGMAVVGFIIFNLYLWLINPLYLYMGKLKRQK